MLISARRDVPRRLGDTRVRDTRLDLWRALCLIDMVLVHLVYDGVNFGPLQRTIGEYTRFAAGGFVFVAGLSIGAIFLPRACVAAERRKTYGSLLRRSLYILCVHYAATLSFVALDLIRGMRADVPALLPLLRDILLLREGGDLLPLYVMLVAASPAMLELLRRRFGWIIAAISSALLFTWGQRHPYAIPLPMNQSFPVVLWQLMFIAGLLFGAVLPHYTTLPRRVKIALAAAAYLMSLLLWAGDFRSDLGWEYPRLPFAFIKTPLSGGEALRYFGLIFAIIFSTDLVWHRIRDSRVVALAASVGRRSLAVYVAHVWIVGLLAMIVWYTPFAGAWQMLLAVPAIASLWVVAKVLDWNESRLVARLAPTIRARWLPVPLGAGAAIILFCTVGMMMHTKPVNPGVQALVVPFVDLDSDPTPSDSDPATAPAFDLMDSADIIPA